MADACFAEKSIVLSRAQPTFRHIKSLGIRDFSPGTGGLTQWAYSSYSIPRRSFVPRLVKSSYVQAHAISASHPTHTGLQGCVTWTCAFSSLAHAQYLSSSSELGSEFDRENLAPSLCAVKRSNHAVNDDFFQLPAVKHVNW